MELSPNQEKIVSVLSDNHDGLGFNDLKKATGLHTKVLNDNLKKLQPEVVTKDKAGVEQWQRTKYKLTIDSDMLAILDTSLASIEIFEKNFDMKKMSMRERNACFPFLIHGIGNYFSEILMFTILLGPAGEIVYQTYQKKFLEHIRHFKENYLWASGNYSIEDMPKLKKEFMELFNSTSNVFPMIRQQDEYRLAMIQASAKHKDRTLFDIWQDLYYALPRISLTRTEKGQKNWRDEILDHELTPDEKLIEDAQMEMMFTQFNKNVPEVVEALRFLMKEALKHDSFEETRQALTKVQPDSKIGKRLKMIARIFGL